MILFKNNKYELLFPTKQAAVLGIFSYFRPFLSMLAHSYILYILATIICDNYCLKLVTLNIKSLKLKNLKNINTFIQ